MTPSDKDRYEILLDDAMDQSIPLLDRLDARAELIELQMDYGDNKEARRHLRVLQRMIWDETEGR